MFMHHCNQHKNQILKVVNGEEWIKMAEECNVELASFHKYVRNTSTCGNGSHRISTECWQKTADF